MPTKKFLYSITLEGGLTDAALFSHPYLWIGMPVEDGVSLGRMLYSDTSGTLREAARYRVSAITNAVIQNTGSETERPDAAEFANNEWTINLDQTTAYGATMNVRGRDSAGNFFSYNPRLAFGLPIAGPGVATNDDGSVCFQNTGGNLAQADPGEFTYNTTSDMLRAPSHVTTATAAQTSSNFSNGEVAMWLDATAGTPAIHFRGKDSAGNVFDFTPGSGIGTVTSVDLTAPAAGITVSGGPITTSGSITLTLADDLAAVEGLGTTGLAARTGTSTWTTRTITGTANRIAVSEGNGVSADPTLDIAATYVGQTSITTLGTIATGTWSATTIAVDKGGTGQTSYTNGQLLIGNTTGNTLTKGTLTQPAAGITITNGGGTITFALADDLAALEALSGTNTIYYRSGASTWTAVTVGSGLDFTAGTLSATGGGGSGTVTSIDVSGGTTGLTFSGGPVTTSGTITMAGTLAIANGGTGQTSAGAALTALGGQPLDATLTAFAALTIGANTMTVGTGADMFSQVALAGNKFLARNSSSNIAAYDVTDFALSVLDDGDAATVRTTLGLGTAATQNTGTSGANVPLLNGTNSWSGVQTFLNASGVSILDTNASHTLGLVVGSNLTANRTLTITTGDADRTLTLTGNASISGTNTGDQSISGDVSGSAANPIVTAFRSFTALSVLGRATNSAGSPADIAAAANGRYLQRNSNTLQFDVILAADLPTITLTGDVTGAASGGSIATTIKTVTSFTGADPAAGDELFGYDLSATANRKFQVDRLLGLSRKAPGGRLTLTTGVPVTTSDVTGATTVYYTPYVDDIAVLWDGTRWVSGVFAETSLALGAVTSGLPYDIFAYLSGGTFTLEKLAWTNGTTRATAITIQDGRYCKSGDKTRLYLGTIYTTSTTATEDSVTKRFVWNMYNRVVRSLKKFETTATWAYTTGTWRSLNNSTANRVEVFRGLNEEPVDLTLTLSATSSSGGSAYCGIGLDSTSSPSGTRPLMGGGGSIAYYQNGTARYTENPGLGYHYFQALEYGGTNVTFFGNESQDQCGLYGTTRG